MVETIGLLRVVRRLRSLAREWWDADLLLADHTGKIHGRATDEGNPASYRLTVPIHINGAFVGSVLVDTRRVLDERDELYLRSLLQVLVAEVVEYEQELARQNQALRETYSPGLAGGRIIGNSPELAGVLRLIESIAHSEAGVLITGESGTGKELMAKCVHERSPRAKGFFVALNCGAFQDQLLESELFGHVRGSFTGALRDKPGLLEQAHGGTLFLDEVGEMSLSMQVKLLRVIQEGTFYPVGSTAPKKVSVRFVAATHRALEEMVAAGNFREDLFYRLNVIRLHIPPLRERVGDIQILVEHFLDMKATGDPAKRKRLHPATLQKLCAYAWPGNVRELQNEVERMVALSGKGTVILPATLSPRISTPARVASIHGRTLAEATLALEREMIQEGLRRTRWNKSRLARELGISRTSLLQKIEKFGLERRARPRGSAATA